MKRFIFRLETLLKVRKAREGKIQRELSYAQQKLGGWQEKKMTLENQIAGLTAEIQKKREIGEIKLQETYNQILDHLNTNLSQVSHTLDAQNRQIAEMEARLTGAARQRKFVEKVKEKQYSQWEETTEKQMMLNEAPFSQASYRG
ncbi:MAG: hypothetical protein K940chlam9_00234 [Chlamydiae bacterium]|nr:hypothetical protein [Chlamydiota bacterium]